MSILLLLLSFATAGAARAAPGATVSPEAPWPARNTEARPTIKSISFTAQADQQGYVVRVRTTGPVSAYGEPDVKDGAIVWTLYNTAASGPLQSTAAGGAVTRYRTEARGNHLVLHFDLAAGAEVNVAAYRDRASDDLLMNISYEAAPPVRVAASEPSSAASTWNESSTEGAAEAETRVPPGEQGGAGERWKFDTVVIDAGHGGHDPGAQSYGLDEKDVVLGIAKKLGGYVEERLAGVEVVYTREDDRFVTLRNRGHIANRAGAKLFISIHANAARNHAAHGTETYFLGTHKTEAARKVMKRENSVIELEDNPGQYENLTDGVMQTLTQSTYMRQSEQLAGFVQSQFEERVERKNRGVKQAGFLVLWAASMPAILVETGFVTNRAEARFLGSDRGQDLIASGLFRAVRTFKQQYEKGLSFAAE